MEQRTIFLIAATVILIAACKTQKQTIVDPREDIQTAIVECISLLEQKQYETLLNKYVYPDDLKEILKKQTMTGLVEQFSGKKAEKLLTALKIAADKEVEYSENNTIGLIKLGDGASGPGEIVFMKKDNFWYIVD